MENVQVSIIIKALNEQENIARCIESCLKETESLKAEIILVDSLSTDSTVEIAKKYPIKVVQFVNQADIGCGAAPQLGYQHSKGDFIYLIDGDMELCEGFLNKAIEFLQDNSKVAGVAGKLVDTRFSSREDERRAALYNKMTTVKNEKHLGGGGLYRKAAIESVGYFSHSGLNSREEFELGARLLSNSWLLKRLHVNSVMHTGHEEGNIQRLCRLWKNGRLYSSGGLLKTAFGKPWFNLCVMHLWYLFLPLLINLFLLLALVVSSFFVNVTFGSGLLLFGCGWLFIFVVFSIKKKSAEESFNSLLTWNVGCTALVVSLFKKIEKPRLHIESKIYLCDQPNYCKHKKV